MVNKITLLRMKKICWKLKKEKAFDEATSISLNTKGTGERYALNMLVEKNIVIKTETGKVYLKQQQKIGICEVYEHEKMYPMRK